LRRKNTHFHRDREAVKKREGGYPTFASMESFILFGRTGWPGRGKEKGARKKGTKGEDERRGY